MKKLMVLLIFAASLAPPGAEVCRASDLQEPNFSERTAEFVRQHSHLSLGLGAETLHGAWGFGVSVTSPFFLGDALALRLSFTEFSDHGQDLNQPPNRQLRPFALVKAGPVWAIPLIGESVRLLVSAGITTALPSQAYAASHTIKGYALLEGEYLPRAVPALGAYLNLGAIQASHSESASAQATYSGYNASAGFRCYL